MQHTRGSRLYQTLIVVAGTLALSACGALHEQRAPHDHPSHDAPAHWSYSGEAGPEAWGSLEEDYFAAAKGVAQSPIDIERGAAIAAQLPALAITSMAVPLKVVNNGHTVQVNCAAGNSLKFAGQDYALQQFHFHSPSEHTLAGKHAAIEMHMVHKSANGQLAVIGVLINEGSANDRFNVLWNNLPAQKGEEQAIANATIDPAALLPTDRGYFYYDGSLTTPPCSEGVRWFVLDTPVELSSEQIAKFRTAYNGNNRPVQPHNARLVLRAD